MGGIGIEFGRCCVCILESTRSHKVRVLIERGRGSPCTPSMLLAHSNTAIWNPRQMPKNGTFCSRAHLIARIIPSVPRYPKPPGTRIPLCHRSQRSPSERQDGVPSTHDTAPCVVVFSRIRHLCMGFEIRRFHPLRFPPVSI